MKLIKVVWLTLLLFVPAFAQAFSAYSNAELDQLERDFIQEINHSPSVMRQPLANDYINHLSKRLAEHGEIDQPDFFIVKSNEINAFAGPGGHIGINTQLILESSTESELAGVMAHEMSHVRQHHLYRMIEHQKQMRIPMMASILAAVALGVINPALSTGALYGALSGFAQDSINFVRSNEKEADRIGIDMLTKSGLDPRGMVDFFKKMQASSRYRYTGNLPAILRTHPLDEERIAEAENRCPPAYKKIISDQSNYHLFKELIRNEVNQDQKQSLEYYQRQCKRYSDPATCEYGYTLRLMQNNRYKQAMVHIKPLWEQSPSNPYYAIAMAQVYTGLSQPNQAVQILGELKTNFPDSYAVTLEYGKALINANQAKKAAALLLVANRQFKHDLQLCNQLARAQAANHDLGYAYFTLAECHMLQGEKHDAVRKLKLAKTFATKDHLLQARIAAKIDEITFK
ncbi:MAG: M48 family metalloprotease [Gammaproteobacteria bacterium]|nr:M48 family metalloprotease [Gammaproteobacteria bacterium]